MKEGCIEEFTTSKIKVRGVSEIYAETTSEDYEWEEKVCIQC